MNKRPNTLTFIIGNVDGAMCYFPTRSVCLFRHCKCVRFLFRWIWKCLNVLLRFNTFGSWFLFSSSFSLGQLPFADSPMLCLFNAHLFSIHTFTVLLSSTLITFSLPPFLPPLSAFQNHLQKLQFLLYFVTIFSYAFVHSPSLFLTFLSSFCSLAIAFCVPFQSLDFLRIAVNWPKNGQVSVFVAVATVLTRKIQRLVNLHIFCQLTHSPLFSLLHSFFFFLLSLFFVWNFFSPLKM